MNLPAHGADAGIYWPERKPQPEKRRLRCEGCGRRLCGDADLCEYCLEKAERITMLTPDFIAYIIGPYRASTIAGVRRNIEAAREIAELLWRNNIPTLCPHLNTALMDGIAPDRVFLDGDLVLLSRCNVAVVLPTAELSTGSMSEVEFARAHHIPIVLVHNNESPVLLVQQVKSFMAPVASKENEEHLISRKDTRIAELEAENKRLRAALSEVQDVYSTFQHMDAALSKTQWETGGTFERDMLVKFWATIKAAALAAKE